MANRSTSMADFQSAVSRRGSSLKNLVKYDPLAIAVQKKRLDSVMQVFAEGFTLMFDDGPNALHAAFDNGSMEIVEYLVKEQGVNVDHPDSNGANLIHKACANDDLAKVVKLFEWGADINISREEDGFSPIHIASSRGFFPIVSALIDRGADPSSPCKYPNESGQHPTPMDLARSNGSPEVIQLLEIETDAELLELKQRKDKALSKLSPNSRKHVNNELVGPLSEKRLAVQYLETLCKPAMSVLFNLQHQPISEPTLLEEFMRLDVNGDGYIMKEEFKRVYESFETFGAPKPDLDAVLRQYSLLGTDRLSFDEYCVLRLKVSRW